MWKVKYNSQEAQLGNKILTINIGQNHILKMHIGQKSERASQQEKKRKEKNNNENKEKIPRDKKIIEKKKLSGIYSCFAIPITCQSCNYRIPL